jgi:hypothetical protein
VDLPYLPFYTRDWRSDPLLRACSLAARGLWIEILALMHESHERGLAVVGARRITERDVAFLARQVGADQAETKRALEELRDNGVYDVADDGTITSRRMVRDETRRAIYAENGRRGGASRRRAVQQTSEQNGKQKPEQTTGQKSNQTGELIGELIGEQDGKPNAGARDRGQSKPSQEHHSASLRDAASGREKDGLVLGDDELDLGKPPLSDADRARLAPAMELGTWFAAEAIKVGALPAHALVEVEAYRALDAAERLLAVHPRAEIEKRAWRLFARKTEPMHTRLRKPCSLATLAALWDDWFGDEPGGGIGSTGVSTPLPRPALGSTPVPQVDFASLR